MSTIKISQLPAKGANLEATDLVEISEFNGSGYVSKSITGQEIIDGASGGGVTDVTATAPISSSGGSTPDISIPQASTIDDGYLSSIDFSTFNAKQDELISGTNIKTINSTSIIGSGDIAISSGVTDVTATSPIASTGGATPDISITQANSADDGYLSTGDWNAFNNKQDALVSGVSIKTLNGASLLGSGGLSVQSTLVSGTNIKTINGNSVLGSGDLTISGGGLQGVHNINGYFSATSQGISVQITAGNNANAVLGINQMWAYPFIPNKSITSVSLKINVASIAAGVNCRILIYSDNNGNPNSKLYESANLDCSTTGIKTAITSFTFNAGTTYWIAVHSSNTLILTGIQSVNLMPLLLTSTFTGIPVVAFINNSIFGSAPAIFSINNTSNGTVPMVGIYLS